MKKLIKMLKTLKKLQQDGHKLILWTVREGDLLDEAVEFCRQRGVEFFAVNSNYPDENVDASAIRSRKLKADMFIDDRNVGGLPDWGVIYEMISRRQSYEEYLREMGGNVTASPKKGVLKRIFG